MKRVVIFLGLILMLFLISNINVKANSSVDLTSSEYDDYYVNSDLIYDMSDVDNIAPFEYNGSTYTIDEYKDSLFNTQKESLSPLIYDADDPIVNIIPRDYFLVDKNKGQDFHYYLGEEYIYFIETTYHSEVHDYCESRVMVIDIDNNINEEDFFIFNNLITVTMEKLFECRYLVLFESEGFGNPNSLMDNNLKNSHISISDNYIGDNIVIPYLTEYLGLFYEETNIWTIDNISVIGLLNNSTQLNRWDNGYNAATDSGYFFIGSEAEYQFHNIETYKNKLSLSKAVSYLLDEENIEDGIEGMIEDYLVGQLDGAIETIFSLFPCGSQIYEGIKDVFGWTYNIWKSTSPKMVESVYSSECEELAETDYLYSNRKDQLDNYNQLIKMLYLKFNNVSLLRANDYIEMKFHYSYTSDTNVVSQFSQLISFDVNGIDSKDGESLSVCSIKTNNIGLEEEEVSITSPLRDEYLLNGCRCVYIVTPDYTQQYTINAGLNDIIVKDSEGNIIGEDNIVYLTKDTTYYIYVSNNNSEAAIYDFYIAGYDIEDNISMSLGDTYLFTYVSDFTGVKYFDSNLLLEVFDYNDIIYFHEGEIYYILITNSTFDTTVPSIEINDIEDIVLDEDGYITNTGKYVKVFDIGEGIYQVIGSPSHAYYIESKNIVKQKISGLFIYSEGNTLYLDSQFGNQLVNYAYEFRVLFGSTLVEPEGITYTTQKRNEVNVVNNSDATYYAEFEHVVNGNYIGTDEEVVFVDAGEYLVKMAVLIYSLDSKNEKVFLGEHGRSYYCIITITVGYNIAEACIDIEDSSYTTANNVYSKTYTINFSGALYYLNFDLLFEGTTIEAYVNNDDNYKSFAFTIDYDLTSKTLLTYKTINIVYATGTTLPKNFTITNEKNNKTIHSYNANSITLKCSVFNMKNGKFGIENTTQFKYFINYYHYGSFSYSDDVNSDIEIYGNINDEFFELLKSINFNGEIVEVSTSIMFNGLFNGNGFSIDGLVLHATWSSNAFGLFSEVYGTFMNVVFNGCRILSSGDTYLHKYIGFITVFNYGYIGDVEFVNVVYLSLDAFYSQIHNPTDPKKYNQTIGIVITSPQNFIYI